MQQASELKPVSAFVMYKKNINKQNVRGKKSKQISHKNTSLITIKKRKHIKKHTKIIKPKEENKEKPTATEIGVRNLEHSLKENTELPVKIKSVSFQSLNGDTTNAKKKKKTKTDNSNVLTIKKQKHLKKQTKSIKQKEENEDSPPILIEANSISSPSAETNSIDFQNQPNGDATNISKNTTTKIKTLVPESMLHDNPLSEAVTLFKWLIAPLSPEAFFEMYWEKKSVHIERSNRNYYKHILDSSSLDKIIRNNPLYYTRNLDVVSYENGVKEVYNQEGRATPSALWDYYLNGCSIRVLNPQTYNQKVHLLIATLQEYFGTMVGTNVYLTPPGSQGFAPHYDDIEAFVVQLEGRKHWKLYHPRDSDVLARYSSGNFKREEIGKPFMQLTLQAGEVLYFPRGTIHEGSTDEEMHSLHITVSVYQQTCYADLLQHILPDALKRAAENDIKFRQGLPLNYLKNFGASTSSDDRNLMMENVKDLIVSLINYIDVDGAADQLGRKLMRDSMPPVLSRSEVERTVKADGAYLKDGSVINRVEIDLDTKVRLLRYYCVRLVIEDGSPKLYYNTENASVYHGEEEQWLELDSSMVPVIQALQNAYPDYMEVDELPMEDVTVKMQLISDLWEHGLLVTEQPLEIID